MMRIWLVVGLFVATMASAFAGNELGNGGDGYAQEFVALGRTMVAKLKENPDPAVTDTEALARAVEATSVTTQDSLVLNGATVDAINYPEGQRIELNRTRWKEYSVAEKKSLVLHEYLGVAKMEDSHYQISGNYSVGKAGDSEIQGRNKLLVSIGSGIQSFSGNIGKLYSNSSLTLDGRVGYLISPYWVARAEIESSKFDYSAAETGLVEINLLTASAAAEFHFFQADQWTGASRIDPYLVAKVGQVFRQQVFQSLNSVQRDNAISAEAGIGAALPFFSKQMSLVLEARAGQVLFKDRYLETYLAESGIADTTGVLLAGNIGVQWYF